MTRSALLLSAALLALSSCESTDHDKGCSDPTAARCWEVGPVINGKSRSVGVPLHPRPHPAGLAIDVPHPTSAQGHVHYVTFRHGPLTGRSSLRLRYRVEMEPGVRILPYRGAPEHPSIVTLYLQRRGDDWSAIREKEAYRWYATFASVSPITAGDHEIVAPLSGNWTAVSTSSRESNPDMFDAALQYTDRVGFVLGGGDGFGHGVYATGPATIVILSYEVR